MVGNSVQGIQWAAVAALVMISTPALAAPCPEMIQPDHWRLPLVLIDHAAKNGPPAIAQAAAALRAGHREQALDFLRIAASIPDDTLLRPPINRPFIEAVLIARENVWLLRGCHD